MSKEGKKYYEFQILTEKCILSFLLFCTSSFLFPGTVKTLKKKEATEIEIGSPSPTGTSSYQSSLKSLFEKHLYLMIPCLHVHKLERVFITHTEERKREYKPEFGPNL